MPGRKIFRATVLACAEDAIKHARRKILHGSTQLENNDLSPAMFEELNDGVETLRTEIDRTVSKWLEAHPLDDPFFIRFRVTVDLSSKFALGSCHELAVQALDYILEHDPDINAEIFSIKHGDHEILVLNRDPRSDPRRPETWGPNAVICDPWADDFYEAYKYRSRLRAYEYDEANKLNHSVKLGPRHELSATRTFNSNYFLREDTVGDLKDRFSVQAQSMIRALEDFRAELVGEQERLKDKPKKKR